MENFAEGIEIRGTQLCGELMGQIHHATDGGALRPVRSDFGRLSLEYTRGAARNSRVKNEQPAHECFAKVLPHDDRRDDDPIVSVEFDEVEPAESGCILILLADGLAAEIYLDVAAFRSEVVTA